MDKVKLYEFSNEIKELLKSEHILKAEQQILDANLTEEEYDFVFLCLHFNGYDPKTDKFIIYESDNSAFLKLVNLVQNKTKDKK